MVGASQHEQPMNNALVWGGGWLGMRWVDRAYVRRENGLPAIVCGWAGLVV